jgi:hypothetical protein
LEFVSDFFQLYGAGYGDSGRRKKKNCITAKTEMASTALHADPVAAAGGELGDDGGETVVVSRSRLQELEACALRAELDARNIQLLQEQLSQAKEALEREQARSEKHAEAFMEVARASDNRARELEAQCAGKLAKLEAAHDAIVVAKNATIAEFKKQNAHLEASHARAIAAKDAGFAKLEREHAALNVEAVALRADAAAKLAAIHAVVTSKFALELHPVRRDRRQFATLHVGPVEFGEPCDEFDTAWCAAACGETWKVYIDRVTHTHAHVTQRAPRGTTTLRVAAPLPRHVASAGASPQQLPSYRVVIEAYPAPVAGKDTQWCNIGFVPSHTSTDGAPVAPVVGYNICHYGGWLLTVRLATGCKVSAGLSAHGWKSLLPRAAAAAGDAGAAETSAYATTDVIPPIPEGSAVEFVVDYDAGTCRVAFYTPEAVASGFTEAPHAKMELRFVATAAEDVPIWGPVPTRTVPTADSQVRLYPAVAAGYTGAVWRLV